MSPPPRTQRALPVDDETLEVSAKRVTWLNVLLGALLAAGVFGFAAHRYVASLATNDDLERARGAAAAERDILRRDVRAVEKNVNDVIVGNKWRDATLKGIADRLGVYTTPPPSLADP